MGVGGPFGRSDHGGFVIHGRTRATTFRRDSNVLEYWLAHGEGFRVASRLGHRRHVDHVIVDPGGGHAVAVVVRSSLGGRHRTLPAHAFGGVDPFRRVLYLERPHRGAVATSAARTGCSHVARRTTAAVVWLGPRSRATATAVGHAGSHTARRTTAAVGSAGSHTARRTAAAAAWLGPHSRAAALTASQRTGAAVEWFLPRFGVALERAAVTVLIVGAAIGRFALRAGAAVVGVVRRARRRVSAKSRPPGAARSSVR
jgi:hypothetical protein